MHVSQLPIIPRAALGLFLLSPLLSGCGKAGAEQGGMGGMPPAQVIFDTVAKRDVPLDFEYPGQAAGSREVEIRARVSGIVDQRLYKEGSKVAKGTALFKIDPAPFAAALGVAEANQASAQARLAQAERDYTRLKPLIEAHAISQQEFDTAASNYDLSKAALKAAQAQVKSARIDLAYSDVRAPISGVIGRALKVEGSLANAAGDSLLATMAQTDPMHVEFAMADADRNKLKSELAAGTIKLADSGFMVKFKNQGGQWLPQQGKLDFADYKADAATGAYASRAQVANADNALAPGDFVRVVLTGALRPSVIALPQKALLDDATGKYVYVVGKGKDGKPAAEKRMVQPGEWVQLPAANGQLEKGWIIRDGLQGGEQVIIEGMARIFMPGQPLAPMSREQAAAAAMKAKS